MKQGTYKARYAVLLSALMVIAALFLVRLIQWQVVQSDYYNTIADTSVKYEVTGDAVRGEIFDVNGVELAVNLTGYRITMNKVYIKDEDLNDTIVRLVDTMKKCNEKWIDELPILQDKNGGYVFDKDKQDEIDELKSKQNLNMNPYSTADECMARLVERYDCSGYTPEQQRNIVSVRYNMTKTAYSKTNPYVFAEGISENTMAVVTEKLSSIKGVAAESTAIRTYTNGTVAPHIVGVTGLISKDEYAELRSKGYSYNDRVGKSGIESAFENELRGSAGKKTYEVLSDGTVNVYDSEATRPGNSVYLTIDARLQLVAQKALKEAVKEANDYAKTMNDKSKGADCTGAAAVVLNVKDFSVLCAANYPSYDVAAFYDDYEKLANDKKLPLFDRAFMGALTPGSTFKPLVASAALQEKKITVHTSVKCTGVYTKGGLKLWCMGYHGEQDLYNAMKNSCNVYFAETGRLLGIEKLETYAKRCGLGVKTGVEVLESAGTLAGPEYSELMGSEWYDSFVSQAAIGQSDNQFTPLQLATYAATIANNGKRLRTHVVDRVVSYYGKEVISHSEPEVVDEMGVSMKNLKEVQKAMNITAKNYDALKDFDINIAGKTGTAENSGSDHANFICYAPFDNPQIAIGVMVEHGAKSFVAIHVAQKIMNAYFKGEGMQEIPKIGVIRTDTPQEEVSRPESSRSEKIEGSSQNSGTSSEPSRQEQSSASSQEENTSPEVPDRDNPDQNNPDPNNPDPNAPDPDTPDQNAPDPNAPDPNTPDQNAPDPNTPDPNAPDPNAPDQNTPDPNAPDPNAPDPNAPDPNTPDPDGGDTG